LGISHLVSWSTNGKSFVIHDKEQFLERVVRKFASKNCKWCDFASTLSHHSFYRNRDDMTKFEFVNDLVIRGKPELAAQIVSNKRQPKAGSNNGSKKIASPKRVRKTTSPEKKRKSAKTTIIPHTAKVYGASELDPMLALDRLNAKRFRLDFHDDFPQALYELLEEAAEHDERYNGTGLSEILGWQPAGNAFKVSRRDLMEDLLKKCSKASCPSGKRYEMFSETLTRFEFTRVKSGREDRWANDLFRRGDTEAIEWLQARASPKHFVDDESTELSFMDFREAMEEMEDVPFLERLHYTLSNAKQFGVDHVLSWQEGGKSLQVHDPEEFEEKILPNISNQGSYISFCSSLNRFNFTNRYTVLGRGSYQHPLFVKGKPEKVVQIEARK
jgi:HSF-type DNA-binding